jgi:hypothetical protein
VARWRKRGQEASPEATASGASPPGTQPSDAPALTAGEREEIETELELEDAEREYLEARARFRSAERRWHAARRRAGQTVRVRSRGASATSSPDTARRAAVGARVLLALVAFWPLAVTVWPHSSAEAVILRIGLVGVAFLFISLCPTFEEELHIDPKGRAWQALVGVGAGVALGLGRVIVSGASRWGATEGYKPIVEALANVRVGPVVGLLELLPILIAAGMVEGIVYGGMLRWVVGKPRGPLPTWAAVALAAVAFGWMHLCVPVLGDVPFAVVGLVNGAVVALATYLTASPLLAGAFLGVQWWVCLAAYYVHLL